MTLYRDTMIDGVCTVVRNTMNVNWTLILPAVLLVIVAVLELVGRRPRQHRNNSQLLLAPPADIIAAFTRREWDTITTWIDTFPPADTTTVASQQQPYPTALHFAILFRAPTALVRRMLTRQSPTVRDVRGETALGWAVRTNASWKTIQMLLEAAPETLVAANEANETPLHHAHNRTPGCPDRILQLLECYTRHQWNLQSPPAPSPSHEDDAAGAHQQRYAFSPLHAAAQCAAACPDTFFAPLLLREKDALLQHDCWGRTPLHWVATAGAAAGKKNTSFHQLLLQAEPRAITIGEASTGRLPLHLAVLHCQTDDEEASSWEECLVSYLLQQTPTAKHRDPVTHLPLCALAPTVDTAFRLLRHDPTALLAR